MEMVTSEACLRSLFAESPRLQNCYFPRDNRPCLFEF